jgi:glutamyl-tRNA synthetase
MDDGKLIQILKDAYPKERITNIPNFGKIVAVEKTRLAKLTDLFDNTEYFFSLPKYISGLLVFKKGTKEDAKKGLAAAREALLSADWTGAGTKEFEDILKRVVEKNTLSNGDVFWPIRVALSGLDKSPSPAELLWIFGQEESLKRIDKALEVI